MTMPRSRPIGCHGLGWFVVATMVTATAFAQPDGESATPAAPKAAPVAPAAPKAAPAAPKAAPVAPKTAPAAPKAVPADRAVVAPAIPKAGRAAALPPKPAVTKLGAPKLGAKQTAAAAQAGSTEAAHASVAPAMTAESPTAAPAEASPNPAAEAPPDPASPDHAEHHEAHGDHEVASEPHTQGHSAANSADEHAGHAESEHESVHHGSSHDSEEPPTFEDINWIYGFLGESDEEEPSFLYRPKGMSVPFVSTLINWGMLVGLIVMLARKQLPPALAKRKSSIVQGMDDAKKLRDESAARLREYEEKLAKIDGDIERVKSEMKQAGEQERDRILAEAVERRTRMERDARRLIDTELEAIKDSLRLEVVTAALAEAKKNIATQVAGNDQERLFDEAVSSLKKLPAKSLGGQA